MRSIHPFILSIYLFIRLPCTHLLVLFSWGTLIAGAVEPVSRSRKDKCPRERSEQVGCSGEVEQASWAQGRGDMRQLSRTGRVGPCQEEVCVCRSCPARGSPSQSTSAGRPHPLLSAFTDRTRALQKHACKEKGAYLSSTNDVMHRCRHIPA